MLKNTLLLFQWMRNFKYQQKSTQRVWIWCFFATEMCHSSFCIIKEFGKGVLINIVRRIKEVKIDVQILCYTLKEETFAVQENREIFTFRGNKLSRMTSYEKFRGNKLSRWTTFKRFHGNKKGENLNLWEETYVFIVLWLWDTWPVLQSLKKSFTKLVFQYSLFLEFLIFWNFTNDTIIWYYNYKSVFFSEYSQMTTFLENFAEKNFRGWRLLKNFAGINFRGFG